MGRELVVGDARTVRRTSGVFCCVVGRLSDVVTMRERVCADATTESDITADRHNATHRFFLKYINSFGSVSFDFLPVVVLTGQLSDFRKQAENRQVYAV